MVPFSEIVERDFVAISPDGRSILTGAEDETGTLWDVASVQPTGQPLVHDGRIKVGAFSPDGKTVLTGSDDNGARLRNTTTGRPIGKPMAHQQEIEHERGPTMASSLNSG